MSDIIQLAEEEMSQYKRVSKKTMRTVLSQLFALKAENDSLQSQLAILRAENHRLKYYLKQCTGIPASVMMIKKIIESMETPQDIKGRYHSEIYWRGARDLGKNVDLNRIRAEAVREHKRWHLNGNPWRVITEQEWDDYANKIEGDKG